MRVFVGTLFFGKGNEISATRKGLDRLVPGHGIHIGSTTGESAYQCKHLFYYWAYFVSIKKILVRRDIARIS